MFDGFGVVVLRRRTLLMLLAALLLAEARLASANEAPSPTPSSPVASNSEPADPRDYQLESVVQQLQKHAELSRVKLAARESAYRERLERSRSRLVATQNELAAAEARGQRLELRFENNRVELNDKAQLLKDKIGALKELFGVFQQNASDLIGAFNGSPTSIQYPDRDIWLEGFANRMKNASEVSSANDIKTLWYELLREINARGDIVRIRVDVHDAEGVATEREVIRVGGFHLIGADPVPEFLQWRAGKQRVETIPRQPAGPYAEQIANYASGEIPLTTLSIDPSGGVLVSLLAEKPTSRERADQGGVVGYMILGLGAIAFILAVIKMIDITLISVRVARQKRQLQAPSAGNSLGRLLLAYRDCQHADTEVIERCLHDRVAKESARIQRFTVFLAIIAAVAPLMGLLGTVVGMINTFQAITLYGTGDPQTMAGGISQALITTVLGLVVAVPAVLLNAMVRSRALAVINGLKQQMALLLGDSLQIQGQKEQVARAHGSRIRPEEGT